ncbi:S-adenosyl-L-methionine-dependent methyltransferase [Mycena pura]|uniref:S-adenosyl-L-methionine-dependent methyltransferase n=1 Tax=Mycena pura TaxID=153505 RepID=A0AAD6YPJ1_9AGAR|nr:S-adenosyl-L-methionine-dependent methyltransferase [Mycena pura]
MTTADTSNFFKRADYSEDYWNNYLATRPRYDQLLYKAIYDYHQSHHGLTETAHDVGTGPGQVAEELSSRFNHVVASDNNSTHLAVAQRRLGPLIASQKVSLVQCSAETLADAHPPCSADLITAAECLPLIDADKAIQAFSTVLKHGGTLAIWFYGRPVFAEPEYASKCQPILESILNMLFSKIIKGGGPQHKTGWARATNRMTSFLDDIELKGDVWQDVERHKWNSEYAMPFYGPEACDFTITRSSKIGPDEKVVEKKDPEFWEKQWDLAGVKRFVLANLPTFEENNQDERVEGKYEELGQAMGGEGAVRKFTWPVVLILASKK